MYVNYKEILILFMAINEKSIESQDRQVCVFKYIVWMDIQKMHKYKKVIGRNKDTLNFSGYR